MSTKQQDGHAPDKEPVERTREAVLFCVMTLCAVLLTGAVTPKLVSGADDPPARSGQAGQGASSEEVGTRGLNPDPAQRPIEPARVMPRQEPPPPIVNAGRCAGPTTMVLPNGTFLLTCPVNSSLGGAQMLVLPEMWVPGNGCIVTVDQPRVVMIGNNLGVTATMKNRCGGSVKGSEGGLAWIILDLKP
jgi:hypothetical protein